MSVAVLEKDGALGFFLHNPLTNVIANTYANFSERREALGLTNPGTVENIAKEVQRDVFLTGQTFSGLRADLTKPHSMSPLFQTSHVFSMGAQGMSPYSFAALYGTDKIFLQGNIDSDKSVAARFNWRWASNLITKTAVQLPTGMQSPMVSIDNEYVGKDFTAQLKIMNPSPIDDGVIGIYVGQYLQSLTPRLALGFEAMYQRQALNLGPETAVTYCAKYKGNDWIASAQVAAQGVFTASYWRRLTEKVEVGTDIQLQFAGLSGADMMMQGPMRKEGVSILGAKYDFRMSTFRAQLDSTGKLSCLMEKRVAPPVTLTFAADLDHGKQQAKVGFAVSYDGTSEELAEMQQSNPEMAGPGHIPF